MGVLSCHGFGDFAVGDCNSQTVIFLLEEVFEQELVDYLLREHVAVDIALLVALLFGEVVEALLICVVFHLGTAGCSHGGLIAEIGVSGGQEVAQNECKQCHDDDYEEQHRLVSDFL